MAEQQNQSQQSLSKEDEFFLDYAYEIRDNLLSELEEMICDRALLLHDLTPTSARDVHRAIDAGFNSYKQIIAQRKQEAKKARKAGEPIRLPDGRVLVTPEENEAIRAGKKLPKPQPPVKQQK